MVISDWAVAALSCMWHNAVRIRLSAHLGSFGFLSVRVYVAETPASKHILNNKWCRAFCFYILQLDVFACIKQRRVEVEAGCWMLDAVVHERCW
jgi:hypothetical protein